MDPTVPETVIVAVCRPSERPLRLTVTVIVLRSADPVLVPDVGVQVSQDRFVETVKDSSSTSSV